MFCKNCGKECSDNALACPACGEPFTPPARTSNVMEKTHAALFAFFLGGFGIHDFLLGKTGRGIGKIALTITGSILLLPFVALCIWTLIDLFHIADGTYPAQGKTLVGDGGTAKALAIVYLVLTILGIIVTVAMIALFGTLFCMPGLTE